MHNIFILYYHLRPTPVKKILVITLSALIIINIIIGVFCPGHPDT